ncbi:MAG: ABC transporter permease [Chthoniobacterales bacterium]|nr:ABC transporter permease [Chthoniobacterales bacterium]
MALPSLSSQPPTGSTGQLDGEGKPTLPRKQRSGSNVFKRLASDYGMVFALLLLGAFFSWQTWAPQQPVGTGAGEQVANLVRKSFPKGSRVLVAARGIPEDHAFATAAERTLKANGYEIAEVVRGAPIDARHALQRAIDGKQKVDVIAANSASAGWVIFQNLGTKFPALGNVLVVSPTTYHWPNFLKTDNLLNIANQIAVIAIIAIGMTMVIITGGIDLSVGSLIALSAVVATLFITKAAGAEAASAFGMTWCCLGGIAMCAALGFFSGVMITLFSIPPFIVTLAMMLVGSGLAYLFSQGQSIYQMPESFVWLGRGTAFAGIPNSVVLMLVLYLIAHIVMSNMSLGRYIYAVGGNREAARLSGVPVVAVLLIVYTLSGALAGLGGVVTASQLKSGSPNYGQMYELYVIAAVVVGGTSLAGGEGKIFGTLIGALIIATIQNGMNLTGVESYTQKVVLGLVILGAVLFDRLKHRGLFRFRRKA